MRLHRFYITELLGNATSYTLHDTHFLHQWRDVFRMKGGEKVVLFDGSGDDFECEIVSLGKSGAELKILEKKKGIVPNKEIWLFASVIKKDNFEMILQKCTEFGVSNFVPVAGEHSEKKGLNFERGRKILIEASEQCGRSTLPILHEIVVLEKALEFCKENKIEVVAFDSSGINYNLQPIHPPKFSRSENLGGQAYKLGLFIGPEGGWSDKEIAIFKEQNIKIFTLGNLTLRAETAAIVAASKFLTS